MITFLMIFTGIALKHKKVGPTFSSFNPCPSLASVGTDDMTQIRCLNIALYNKPRPLPILNAFSDSISITASSLWCLIRSQNDIFFF